MQENQENPIRFQADAPYPLVQASSMNHEYGLIMLDNLGGQTSEMSAVSLYFYNSLVTNPWKEIADTFHHINMVEMRHLEIFGTLAMQCGEDPRLWSRYRSRYSYWSPAYNQYPSSLKPLLLHAIQSETAARDKYLRQQNWINDGNIKENLNRIAMDEQIHIEILTRLYQAYC